MYVSIFELLAMAFLSEMLRCCETALKLLSSVRTRAKSQRLARLNGCFGGAGRFPVARHQLAVGVDWVNPVSTRTSGGSASSDAAPASAAAYS